MKHRSLLIVAAASACMWSSAFAGNTDKFNATGVQVVTHRGSDLVLHPGTHTIDVRNKMTCTSDTGCAIVIQTLFNGDNAGQEYSPLKGTICTYVDQVAADPVCVDQGWTWGPLTSFQGQPSLTKGDHIVQTTFTNADLMHILSWQVVYTLYQH